MAFRTRCSTTVVFAAGTRTEAVRVETLDLFRGEHASFVPLVQHGTPPRQETDSSSDRTGGVMGNPVVHFEIGGHDAVRTRAFYSELFDWDVEGDPSGYGLVDTRSEGGIRGGMMQTPPQVPAYVTFYVGVDDLDKYLRRAQELGGSKVLGPMAVGRIGAFAMFADPDGNLIGLFREDT